MAIGLAFNDDDLTALARDIDLIATIKLRLVPLPPSEFDIAKRDTKAHRHFRTCGVVIRNSHRRIAVIRDVGEPQRLEKFYGESRCLCVIG
jgi:hypothetical protein